MAALFSATALSQDARAANGTPSFTAAVALDTPVELQFEETPLTDAVAALAAQAGVSVDWDDDALEEAGIDRRAEVVSLALMRPVRFKSGLALVLHELDLYWEDFDDRIRITTRAHWNDKVVTVNYHVADLLATRRKPIPSSSAAELIGSIESLVAPDTWSKVSADGVGELELKDGVLRVTHHRQTQDLVADFLAQLREKVAAARE